MKKPWKSILLAMSTATAVLGCTSVVVKKDPGDHNKGFRYYMPKPYLLISPSTTTVVGEGEKKTTTTKPVVVEMKYLPDYEEKYSVRLKPGIGKGKLEVELEDGWNLTKVGLETDQQIDEIIAASGEFVGAVGGLIPGLGVGDAPGAGRSTIYATSNVPFGYYEPVFAQTPRGKKIVAWKYIGFLPYGTCPSEIFDDGQATSTSSLSLYGLGVTDTGIPLFRPLPYMSQPGVNIPVEPVSNAAVARPKPGQNQTGGITVPRSPSTNGGSGTGAGNQLPPPPGDTGPFFSPQ